MRKRRGGHKLAAALAVPIAIGLSWAPAATAATVLAVEGTGQPKGTTQTAFQGAFCQQNTCRSINNNRTPFDVALGSSQIHTAVAATAGDVIVMAYSLGAASTYHRLREWAEKPADAPDPGRIVLVVTFGNPENKFGGDDRNLFWTGLPTEQPYQHLEVAMQYDSVADRPTRWGFFSSINTAFARHLAYFDAVDINDPDNLVYRDGTTTYMLIKADVLPMLEWLDPFIDDGVMAKLDATFRPLVERDYRRPAFTPQGEGADWGNGSPPPGVDEVDDAQPPERPSGDEDDAAATEDDRQHKSEADEPTDADVDEEAAEDQGNAEVDSAPDTDTEPAPDTDTEPVRETESPTAADSEPSEDPAPDGAADVAG